jgi:hypothetical protein
MLAVELGCDGFPYLDRSGGGRHAGGWAWLWWFSLSGQVWYRLACWWLSLVEMVFLIWTGMVEAGMLVVEFGCDGFPYLDRPGGGRHAGGWAWLGFPYVDRPGGRRHAGGLNMVAMVFLIWTCLVAASMLVVELGCESFSLSG